MYAATTPSDDLGSLYREHVNPHLLDMLSELRLDVCYVSGSGSWLTDARGRRVLDFVCGYGSVGFGHSPPMIAAAIERYVTAKMPALVQPSILDSASRLAAKLAAVAPHGLRHVWFTNSGAESVETAIKACRAVTRRSGVIYAQSSFHGKTLGALSATGTPRYQNPFGAPVPHFHSVPYSDAAALERFLVDHRETIACVILEPIQGEGGINVPTPGYLPRVRELCTRHGVLLIFDEVQTGLGRTGTLFACEYEAVVPDCIALSKILGAGVVPIGCVLLSEAAFSRDFAMLHSSTYAGNALACEVGLAVMERLTDPATAPLNNVKERSAQLRNGLLELAGKYPAVVRSVRGRGLLLGVELRCDEGYGGPGQMPMLGVWSQQGGLIALVSSHLLNVEGIRTAPTLTASHVLRIEPALTVSEPECEQFLRSLDRVFAHLARNDTAAMLEHLVPGDETRMHRESAPGIDADPRPLPARQAGDTPVAFLVHLLNPDNIVDYDYSLRRFGAAGLRKVADIAGKLCEPFVIGQTRVQCGQASVYMEFICVPQLPDALLALTPAQAEELIGSAVTLAATRGAKLVGLGGFTSIVTSGGANVTHLGVPVTTGNTYTALTAVSAVREAANTIGLDIGRACVVVLGAAGMIGGTLVDSFFGNAAKLVLIGNPQRPTTTRRRLVQHLQATLEAGGDAVDACLRRDDRAQEFFHSGNASLLAEAIVDRRVDLGLICDSDVSPYLDQADVIVCATSSTEFLVDVSRLKSGAIVLDLSRPHNIERSAIESRPDVLFIDGGVVAFPGLPHLGVAAGVPQGHGLACMAETAILGLAGHLQHMSVGARADRKTQRFLAELADRFDFRLSGLRTMNRALTDADWRSFVAASGVSLAAIDDDRAVEAYVSVAALSAPLTDQPINLAASLLHRHRIDRASQVALIDSESDEQATFGDLWRRVVCTARRFSEAGLQRGEVIGILGSDSVDLVVALLAGWWVGIAVAPLNPDLPADDHKAMLDAIRPKMIFVGESHSELIARFASIGYRCERQSRWTRPNNDWTAQAAPASPCPLTAGDPAVYLFSSGSVGKPKAVVHTHGDFVTVNGNYTAIIGLRKGDRVFSVSRIFFAYGLLALTFGLFHGGSVVLAPKPQRRLMLVDIIEKYRPQLLFVVPTVLKFICDQLAERKPLRDLRLCVSAGETLTVSLCRRATQLLGVEVIDGIGCTEALSTFISNRPGDSKAGSTGMVVPGFSVRLVDEDGKTCPVGRTGVLWIKGNTVADRILGDPALTDKVFCLGWFNTNDLFYMDDQRRFHYVGRVNDVLKINACWVAPSHIEEVLADHPAIFECAVIPTRDEYGLIRPKAVIVMKPDASIDKRQLWEELRAHCKQRLGAHQYPHIFELSGGLPKTASGKLQRALLR